MKIVHIHKLLGSLVKHFGPVVDKHYDQGQQHTNHPVHWGSKSPFFPFIMENRYTYQPSPHTHTSIMGKQVRGLQDEGISAAHLGNRHRYIHTCILPCWAVHDPENILMRKGMPNRLEIFAILHIILLVFFLH